MTRNRTRTTRKASTVSKPASVPIQAPALGAEEGRADIYQRITDRIAAAIEAEAGTWQMPWHPGADGPRHGCRSTPPPASPTAASTP